MESMNYVRTKVYLGVFLTLFMAKDALARMPYLLEWNGIYPDSTSDNAGCQLCHQDVSGGQPWNAYGWEIKQEFVSNGGNIEEAIESVFATGEDSDSNPGGATNLTEINDNFQPGWTLGANNTVYSCIDCDESIQNVTQISGQSPPGGLPASIVVDPPIPLIDPIPGSIPYGEQIALEDIADGFIAPNYATPAPGLEGYLFVVDQIGKIWQVDLSDGSKTVFLDVSSQICDLNTGYDERGLLGLAFHPQYATNGLFYTYQSEEVAGNQNCAEFFGSLTPNHKSVVAEWLADDPRAVSSNVSFVRNVIEIDQPQFNHNGGMISFSPIDNYLYISVGDGGNADDQGAGHVEGGNGQDTSNMHGAILRIDPLGGGDYRIPLGNDPNNEFGADEIFAYGFRNVWRFSFDSDGNLYAGDVGQNDIEEVNLVEIGRNYGWNAKEGSFYFYDNGEASGYVSNTMTAGGPTGLVDPILEYDHDEGVSVIGGYVYEGIELEGLNGAYFFGEFNGKLLYSSDLVTIQRFRIQNRNNLGFLLMGYGRDTDGELYVMGRPNTNLSTDSSNELGVLKKLVPAADDQVCFPVIAVNGSTTLICL